MKVGVECSFDAAHRLMNHPGKCKHLHGHRYRAMFEFESSEPAPEMVLDFAVIKSFIRKFIDERYDHATLVNVNDDYLVKFLHDSQMRYLAFHQDPTAETIAVALKHEILESFDCVTPVKLVRLRLYETPTNYAEVTA